MNEAPLKAKEKKDEWLISSSIKGLPYTRDVRASFNLSVIRDFPDEDHRGDRQ